MSETPRQIAERMALQHGVEAALAILRDAILQAQANGDNYRLSLLRDVRRILRDQAGPT